MEMMKVHGHPTSLCTARVLLCLHEIGLDFELVEIDFDSSAHKRQPFLSLNPFGLVPAIEDGYLNLFESRAIVRYLARKHRHIGPDLLQLDNPTKSAIVETWMEVEAHQFNQPMTTIIQQTLINPLEGLPTNEEVVKAGIAKLEKVFNIYEERLTKSKYLAGDHYTLADLTHIPILVFFMRSPNASLVTSRPHLSAWWSDISSRPASIKVSKDLKYE